MYSSLSFFQWLHRCVVQYLNQEVGIGTMCMNSSRHFIKWVYSCYHHCNQDAVLFHPHKDLSHATHHDHLCPLTPLSLNSGNDWFVLHLYNFIIWKMLQGWNHTAFEILWLVFCTHPFKLLCVSILQPSLLLSSFWWDERTSLFKFAYSRTFWLLPFWGYYK